MKRRNREISIFGMSALDLFASAMGAFILLAIVIFPYFPNIGSADQRDLDAALQRLRQEEDDNNALQSVLRAIREDLERRLRAVQDEARRRVAAAQQAADEARRDAEAAQRDAEAAQRDAEAARRELEEVRFPHLDLVIALDVTVSMAPVISGLKSELNDIVGILTSLAPTVAIGMVTFRDRCERSPLEVFELTEVSGGSAGGLTSFVDGLRADSDPCNTDNPEAFLAALRTATEARWRPRAETRQIVIIGDNPAYPEEIESAVAAAASFAAAGGGRSVSTVQQDTPDADPGTGAFLRRVAAAGRGEAVGVGESTTATLLRSML